MVAVGQRAASTWKPVPRVCKGAPAGRGWPWRRSRAPLSAPRKSAKVGSRDLACLPPAAASVGSAAAAAAPHPSAGAEPASPAGAVPGCAHQQLIGHPAGLAQDRRGDRPAPALARPTADLPSGLGLWAGPAARFLGSVSVRAAGAGGDSGTSSRDSGADPGAAPPGLKAKARAGLARVTVFLHPERRGRCYPEPPGTAGNRLASGLSCPHYVPSPPSRGWGREGLGRRRLLREPPMPSQRGI